MLLTLLKYLIFFIIIQEAINIINFINFFIIVLIFLCISFNNNKKIFEIFINIYLSIIILKYITKFKVFFYSFESHFHLLLGLSFNPEHKVYFGNSEYKNIEFYEFFKNIYIAFFLFIIKKYRDYTIIDKQDFFKNLFKSKSFYQINVLLYELY